MYVHCTSYMNQNSGAKFANIFASGTKEITFLHLKPPSSLSLTYNLDTGFVDIINW